MVGPASRAELVEGLEVSFGKLTETLAAGGKGVGALPCIDDWTVRELLAVRVWWSERVIDWVEAGRAGEVPETPAEGYRWSETPRLNAGLVDAVRAEPGRDVEAELSLAYARALRSIEELSDRELFEAGVFEWAGKYTLGRWIAMNTTRQYTTARTHIRRALRRRSAK